MLNMFFHTPALHTAVYAVKSLCTAVFTMVAKVTWKARAGSVQKVALSSILAPTLLTAILAIKTVFTLISAPGKNAVLHKFGYKN